MLLSGTVDALTRVQERLRRLGWACATETETHEALERYCLKYQLPVPTTWEEAVPLLFVNPWQGGKCVATTTAETPHSPISVISSSELQTFYTTGRLETALTFDANTYTVLDDGLGGSALARFDAALHQWVALDSLKLGDFSPKNSGQRFLWDALSRPEVRCVVTHGATGSGKTLLAILFGVHAVQQGQFEKITLIKPHVDVGKGLGYLPGGIDEKIDPYYQSFYGALRQVAKAQGRQARTLRDEEALGDELFEILPVPYVRGLTLADRWVIVDEVQNCSPHEIKTILTRIDHSSRVILCGDVDQQDVRMTTDNGLVHVLKQFRGLPFFAQVELTKVLRGPVADAADRLL